MTTAANASVFIGASAGAAVTSGAANVAVGYQTGKNLTDGGNNVLIGAGAKILGNISVGDCSRVAAGSLVLKSVHSFKTVAGVPAKEVGTSGCPEPSKTMDQLLKKN